MEQEQYILELISKLDAIKKAQFDLGVPMFNPVTGELLVKVNYNGIIKTLLLNIF